MARILDKWLATFATGLAGLDRRSFAVFFAYMAERLMPLYVAFERKHGWGDSAELLRQLDFVWSALGQSAVVVPPNLLRRLEALTPSGEQFDSPDSTYAQDAVICVDAAVRALMPSEVLDGNWVEYAVEPVKTKVSLETTGYSSIEGAGAEEWELRLMSDPRVADFLSDCESVLLRLKSNTSVQSQNLRDEARSKQLQLERYIPL